VNISAFLHIKPLQHRFYSADGPHFVADSAGKKSLAKRAIVDPYYVTVAFPSVAILKNRRADSIFFQEK
jgi:hypothetical protein